MVKKFYVSLVVPHRGDYLIEEFFSWGVVDVDGVTPGHHLLLTVVEAVAVVTAGVAATGYFCFTFCI